VPDADESERPAPEDYSRTPRLARVGMVVGVGTVVFMLGAGAAGNADMLRAVVVVPVLACITYVVAKSFAAIDERPVIVPIVMGGFGLKLAGTLIRDWVSNVYYGGGDSLDYDQWGQKLAPSFRHFHWVTPNGTLRGTNFLRTMSGIAYAITPGGIICAFLVFSFLSFLGMIFFWRAYRRAISTRSDLRYLKLLVFLPSLAFWPSALGKDAWVVLGVGIASYGVALILTDRLIGWLPFAIGVAEVMYVRPHVAIPIVVGLLLAELVRRRGPGGSIRLVISVALVLFAASIILSTSASFLGVGGWSQASVSQELDNVGGRTTTGGSQFHATKVSSPVQFPIAALNVLFRPLPYEARSGPEMYTAIEDAVLLGLFIWMFRRIARAVRRSRRRPYLLYCIGMVSLFVVEYSSFSNFAIIARERTQAIPLLLVLLCLTPQDLDPKETPPQPVSAVAR
jgi:hypothetical protein